MIMTRPPFSLEKKRGHEFPTVTLDNIFLWFPLFDNQNFMIPPPAAVLLAIHDMWSYMNARSAEKMQFGGYFIEQNFEYCNHQTISSSFLWPPYL